MPEPSSLHPRARGSETAQRLVRAAGALRRTTSALAFSAPVHFIYRPLEYAWGAHACYLRRYGAASKRVLFLGMNPGPWGMMQTGIPFGDIGMVTSWLAIHRGVRPPQQQHRLRPITGFECRRGEVSGRRLWGLMRDRFGTPQHFFREHFVANYCPLAFLQQGGQNWTPDRLHGAEQEALFAACDRHLSLVLQILQPAWAVGVGSFATSRLHAVTRSARPSRSPGASLPRVGGILHPSPASPQANAGWASRAAEQLRSLGVWA